MYVTFIYALQDKASVSTPEQNPYIESLHSRFREECPEREQLWTLLGARVVLEDISCLP